MPMPKPKSLGAAYMVRRSSCLRQQNALTEKACGDAVQEAHN